MILSLPKPARNDNPTDEQEILRAASFIIGGIALHPPTGNEEQHAAFREEIRRLRAKFEDPRPLDHSTVARSVVQALHRYDREIADEHASIVQELRSVIFALTETLRYACNDADDAAAALQMLEKAIEEAAGISNYRKVKRELETYLSSVRSEIDRQHAERPVTQERAQPATSPPAAPTPRTAMTDPVTRLPDRNSVRAALTSIIESSKEDAYGVCMRLDTLSGINAACGYEAGDEYLLLVSRLIRQSLRTQTVLYRWSGPGFFLIAPNRSAADEVQRRLERLSSIRGGHVLSAGFRSIAVGITISFAKYAIHRSANVDEFMARVDKFISATSQGLPTRV